jgi:ABC-type antimicrobial peptide transport system permease subunit
MAPAIRRALREADGGVPIVSLRTVDAQLDTIIWPVRVLTTLLALFAGGSLFIAVIGQYAAVAFDTRRRSREFGLRLALGASPGAVQRLVLRQVVWLVAIGGGAGLAIAVGVGRYAQGTLFNMSAVDPAALTASATVLALVALAAAFVPSRRAARVDPMRALRWE